MAKAVLFDSKVFEEGQLGALVVYKLPGQTKYLIVYFDGKEYLRFTISDLPSSLTTTVFGLINFIEGLDKIQTVFLGDLVLKYNGSEPLAQVSVLIHDTPLEFSLPVPDGLVLAKHFALEIDAEEGFFRFTDVSGLQGFMLFDDLSAVIRSPENIYPLASQLAALGH
ncbi:MAG: hypothetical protein A3A61_00245 [Candidatus Woykebacteria bacterium RIFCSPLOWO2_01_FULL_43_14]|uniref:Uncharacterized protein n=2 Tax=Candidatus Woykeibacteriota TaxID=1817899 RepID=A0A1G1WUI8_9BACT|nr:MAG: hypothetical protein A3J50_03630 [Candidatus Woykebacteria bacterium RIFCSPHIGHO2_02_FULL_43_16b]OGY30837.1 MAG: hypothetical protein A3A61_00245 [Candidatus Woykebacteria bacterium RIFCSPLOWO2_01_FULL_43_14]